MPEIPFEYPVVVKPSNGGLKGTHIVHNEAELQPAVEDALFRLRGFNRRIH